MPFSVNETYAKGDLMKAYVLINTTIGKEQEVVKQIRKFSGVTSAECTYGVYDMVAIVEGETKDRLREIVGTIRKQKEVRSTLSMWVISP